MKFYVNKTKNIITDRLLAQKTVDTNIKNIQRAVLMYLLAKSGQIQGAIHMTQNNFLNCFIFSFFSM